MKANKIVYTGTNEDEIMKIIPISVSLIGAVKIGDFAIFKDDVISIEKDGIYVEKPAYVGTGKHKIEIQTSRGIDICTFSISTVPANGQKNLEGTEYDVLAWGNIAKPCEEHCSKGKGIRISGRMKQEYWVNSEGKALSRIVLLAEEVEFIPSREKEIPEENT